MPDTTEAMQMQVQVRERERQESVDEHRRLQMASLRRHEQACLDNANARWEASRWRGVQLLMVATELVLLGLILWRIW